MSRYNHADHLIDKKYRVLDKGFVCMRDYFGSDEAIEAAARNSYQKGTRKTSDTRGLIRYLLSHEHSSPVEQASITFDLKMPLYVIQQLLRHRTAKLNMASFRYSEVPDEQQKTPPEKWRLQSLDNKQGSNGYLFSQTCHHGLRVVNDENGAFTVTDYTGEEKAEDLSVSEERLLKESMGVYNTRLSMGIAKEQARKDIPVSTYSTLYWTMDVRNLLHFMSLRCDKHAQEEIRDYANVIAGFVKEIFPITFEAWYDYQYCSVRLSRMDRKLLESIIKLSGYELKEFQYYSFNAIKDKQYMITLAKKAEELGMTKREFREFWNKMSPPTEKDFSLNNELIIEGEDN